MRGGRGSTFIVEGGFLEEDSSYQMEMLRKNQLAGLLPVQVCAINESYEYYYNAGSRVCLAEYLSKRTINSSMLGRFIESIKRVLSSIEEYLLEINCLCMEPEHIYMDEEEGALQFCYGPVVKIGFEKGLLKLLQFFLEKLDYDDRECVTMAYQIYQNVMREGYVSVFTYQIIEQPEASEIVFPWEEDEEERKQEQMQGEANEAIKDRWREGEHKEDIWGEENGIEKIGIYVLGIVICGLAAGFCYWQRNIWLCGAALLVTVAILYGLIRYGRRDKGIDSVQNTW